MCTLTDAELALARSPFCTAARRTAPMLGLVVFLLAMPVLAQTRPATSVEEGATPMDQMDMTNPQPGEALVPGQVTPEKKSPFFDDSKISAQARTFYFYRSKFDDSISEAWALGGSVSYLSGYAANLVRLGGVAYTSQPLYAPDDRDGTSLLMPGQEGYSVLGQIYAEFKLTEIIFGAFGRKEYNTPFINAFDVRMTPKTFEGVTVYGSAGGENSAPTWKFGGGYISKIKEWTSQDFIWMSVDAGASVNRGVYLAGANYENKDFSFGGINYYSADIINIFYTEAKYALLLGEGMKLKLHAQFADQQSTGDDLLTGSAFSTYQWGVKADLGLGASLLTLAYTDTADGADMQNPWSGYPGYTSVQVENFFRANEAAVMLKAAYDFSSHGLKGTSAYALWVHGSGVQAPAYNEDEMDLNLQWTPDKTGALRGLSFRLRYALVMQKGGGDPNLNDFRFIVNYDFPRP
jgi:hypothetical protein